MHVRASLPSHMSISARNNTLLAAVILGGAFVAGSAIQSVASASRENISAAPTSIAMLDLARLMNSLNELKDRNDQTLVRGKGMKEKLDEIANQIKAIEAELKDVIPKEDKTRRLERVAQKFELEATLEARAKGYNRMIDLDHGDILNDLYPKALAAAKDFASKNGYDVVIMDDRPIPLPDAGTVKDYNEVIQRKRVIYAKDGMDITEQVITLMNNEYAASTKK